MSQPTLRAFVTHYLRPHRSRLSLLAGLFVAGVGMQLANPLLAKAFLDRASDGAPFDELVRLAAVFLGVALLTQAATVAEVFVAGDLGWRTTNTLRTDLTAHVLALDESFHADHGAGEMLERIDGDVGAIAGFFGRFVVNVLGSGVFLIGVLALLWREEWRIGALMTLFASFTVAWLLRRGEFVGRRSRASRVANADLSGYLEERLSALCDIKSNGADDATMRGLHVRLANRFTADRDALLASALFSTGANVALVGATVTSLAVAGARFRSGALTLGGVYLVFRYTTMLHMPLERLARHMSSFQRATGGIVRVRELLAIEPRIASGTDALPPGALSVAFDRVEFSYDDQAVLRGVDFELAPGRVLGVVGRTGSGKTTMTRLLFRLYDVRGGAVRVGGVDVRDARLTELHARIGLVTQDVQLFTATLRDNVALFDPSVDDAAIVEVFATLGLGGWLAELPEGLDTVIGHAARGLSAGEGQLVALARVFLKDPGLVVLDEASSRLDPHTERLLEQAIDRLVLGRTAIVIAHRLRTIERADDILVLEHGEVVEQGERARLVADPRSRFTALLRAGLEEVTA